MEHHAVEDPLGMLAGVAEGLGDTVLSTASGFAGTVAIGDRYVYRLVGTTRTKGAIVSDWLTVAANPAAALVPASVHHREVGAGRYVSVETRIRGKHPETLSPAVAGQLGDFLRELHSLRVPQVVDQFEGERLPSSLFWEWTVECATTYTERILGSGVDKSDSRLVDDALAEVKRFVGAGRPTPTMRLLHKDVHPGNLLLLNRRLVGVVDWDAAMLGPVEWELAILRQRFPTRFAALVAAYDRPYSEEVLVACGLVQALRFWKSFPRQTDFVESQRTFISALLAG